MKKVTQLEPRHHQKSFRATIQGDAAEGKIYYDANENEYYLCQNTANGSDSPNKLGYRHSWSVLSGNLGSIESSSVRNLYVEDAEYVYVSDTSEKDALIEKNKRILICKDERFACPYLCVTDGDEGRFLRGEKIAPIFWRYAVPVPEKTWEIVPVQISDEFNALICQDEVVVGCQHITFEKVEEVYAAVLKAREFSKEEK